jgi:hypothetical protein
MIGGFWTPQFILADDWPYILQSRAKNLKNKKSIVPKKTAMTAITITTT